MKKMNGLPIEIEPGTTGYEHLDCAGFNRALNARAKRRGIDWENPFRRSFVIPQSKKKGAPHGR